jgi:hypothetical protein
MVTINDQKIIKVELMKPEVKNETIHSRPNSLKGTTYKLKTPLAISPLYVTINDIEFNGKLYPFELFINTKDNSSFQFVTALTRVISAIFRNNIGNPINSLKFLIEELGSVFDSNGGYIKKGMRIPSLVAEIAYLIEEHLQNNNILEKIEKLDIVDKKPSEEIIKNATQCPECQKISLIKVEGCMQCLNCGYSKCG